MPGDALAFLRITDKYAYESQVRAAFEWIKDHGHPVDQILAARILSHSEEAQMLLVDAFAEWSKESGPITLPEGKRLTGEDVTLLWHLREYWIRVPDSTEFRRAVEKIILKNEDPYWVVYRA